MTEKSSNAHWRTAYADAWRVMLRELLAWPSARIEAWVQDRLTALEGNPFLTHEYESYYILPLLVPDSLRDRLGEEQGRFLSDVQLAIDSYFPDCDEDYHTRLQQYDWKAARQRIERLLNEKGDSLANRT